MVSVLGVLNSSTLINDQQKLRSERVSMLTNDVNRRSSKPAVDFFMTISCVSRLNERCSDSSIGHDNFLISLFGTVVSIVNTSHQLSALLRTFFFRCLTRVH